MPVVTAAPAGSGVAFYPCPEQLDFYVFPETAPSISECYSGRCDASGDYYVQCIGDFPSVGVFADTGAALAKYATDGTLLWAVPVDFVDQTPDILGDRYVAAFQNDTSGFPHESPKVQSFDTATGAVLWTSELAPFDGSVVAMACALRADGNVWVAWHRMSNPSQMNVAVLDGGSGAIVVGPVTYTVPSAYGGVISVIANKARTQVFVRYSTTLHRFDATLTDLGFAGAAQAFIGDFGTAFGSTTDGGLLVWTVSTGGSLITKFTPEGLVAWTFGPDSIVEEDAVDNIPVMDGLAYFYGFDAAAINAPTQYEFGGLLALDECTGEVVSYQLVNEQPPSVDYDDYSGLDTYGIDAANGFLWVDGAAYDDYNSLDINTTAGDQGYVSRLACMPPNPATSSCVACGPLNDSFSRTVTDGWGTMDTGQAWSPSGVPATDLSVDGSTGLIVAGGAAFAYLCGGAQALPEIDIYFEALFPVGGGLIEVDVPRSGTEPYAYFTLNAGPHFTGGPMVLWFDNLFAAAIPGHGASSATGPDIYSGFDTTLWVSVRMHIQNSRVSLKAWYRGGTEPSHWSIEIWGDGTDPNGFNGPWDLSQGISHGGGFDTLAIIAAFEAGAGPYHFDNVAIVVPPQRP